MSIKKNNKRRANLSFSFSSIIRNGMTTKSQLEFLAKKLNIQPLRICWLKDFDPYYKEAQIINLGSPSIGGTHWVCTYNNMYFDSFGLIPPPEIEEVGYQWVPLQKQNHNYGHCGSYCILWLYYAKLGELDQFYNMFETLA